MKRFFTIISVVLLIVLGGGLLVSCNGNVSSNLFVPKTNGNNPSGKPENNPEKFTITFDPNEYGEGEMNALRFTVGDEITLSEYAFTSDE